MTHIFSANVPNPAITSFVLGMLVKAHNTGKLSSRDGGFLDIYLESLRKHDALLARDQSLIRPGNKKALERSLAGSDAVVVYGGDETVAELKKQTPAKAIFSGYGHRVSFGLVLKEALTLKNTPRLARAFTTDFWMLDQRGCLSPNALYIEVGGQVSAEAFSHYLAKALKHRIDRKWNIFYQPRWKGLALNSGSRTVFIRPFRRLEKFYKEMTPFSQFLQSAAVEGDEATRNKVAERLSELGVNRITRAGRMQHPPITWMHDGRPNLSDWLHWTDLE